MAAGAAVPWETCAEAGCLGAGITKGGPCLVHAPPEALAAWAASAPAGPDLDGRGVRFTPGDLARVLDAVPPGDAGPRVLGRVRLDGAVFEEGASFDDVTFTGQVSAAGALFEGDCRFGGSTFARAADFGGATFQSQAWFVGAAFGGPASFRNAAFHASAWFQQASFRSSAGFEGAVFSREATFSAARFDGVASFVSASFEGHARFDRSSCGGEWRFEGARARAPGQLPVSLPLPPADPLGPPVEALLDGRSPMQRPRPRSNAIGIDWRIPLAVLLLVLASAFVIFRPVGTASPAFEEDAEEGTGGYGFLHKDPKLGTPTRYNPCAPVRIVVNPEMGPPGWMRTLDDALYEVNIASGLDLQIDGMTDEEIRPDFPADTSNVYGLPKETAKYSKAYSKLFGRESYQPDRYGKDRWAPVLIGWARFSELGVRDNRFLGIGASDPRPGRPAATYVSGSLLLNAEARFDNMKATLMHELGHVVGLAHISNPNQVMHPTEQGIAAWGAGDREGLRLVGSDGGCVDTPRPG